MSLYNNAVESLQSGKGLRASFRGALGGALGGAAAAMGSALGGSKMAHGLANKAATMASNRAMAEVDRRLNKQLEQKINDVIGVANGWENGNPDAVFNHAMSLLGYGYARSLDDTALAGFAGLTGQQARALFSEVRNQPLVKKNLWCIEVSSPLYGEYEKFNLLATELDFNAFDISADKKKIGSAVIDSVQGNEPVELTVTTYDTERGELKKWFAAHHAAVVARDGTVGLPAEYALKIKILHGFINQETQRGGYSDMGYFRPQSLNVNLSRRDDNLQELNMTFSQLDTFFKV